MEIPFKRICIFDSFKILGKILFNPQSEDPEKVLSWVLSARKKGADAFYMRMHDMAEESSIPLLRLMGSLNSSFVPQLIVPAALVNYAPHFTGLHFKSGEAFSRQKVTGIYYSRSCHSEDEVINAQEEGMDFVFFSPVFSTTSHPDAVAKGLNSLEKVCKKAQVPVFALGGVTVERELLCLDAGARGIAGISIFLP